MVERKPTAKETLEANSDTTKTKNVMQMNFLEASKQPQYVTDTGKILPRKYTGLSAREQRRFSRLIKQGRNNLTTK